MKILIVTARYYPEPFSITNIAEKLHEMGHDITVITGKPNYGKWSIYSGYSKVKNEIINGVKIIRVNESIRKKGFLSLLKNFLSIYFCFKKELNKMTEKFDIVLGHVLSPIFSVSGVHKFCKKNKIPSVLYGFDLWPESLIASGYCTKKSLLIRWLKKYCKNIYQNFDYITFASKSAEVYFREYLNISTPFKHIYQPCLTKLPDNFFVANHDFMADGKINILFCGTIAKFNHLHLFIEALNKSNFKDKFVFNIVGSGSDLDNIKQITKKLNLEQNVIFHGRVPFEETKRFYQESDVLFVPLYYNSATSLMVPQKLIEYFMYARPILGMIKGDGEDLLRNASCDNIIVEQTVDGIADGLHIISSYNKEKMEKCGEENRNFYINNPRFSLEVVAKEIEEVLFNTLKNAK